jgi:thioredoxin-related protein
MKTENSLIKNIKTISIVLLSVLFLLSFTNNSEHKKLDEGLKIGKVAPLTAREMPNIDNSMHTLEKLKMKKGLLVVFSCNTCPFVVGSSNFAGWEKQYNEIHSMSSKAEIGMVLVNSNEGKRADADSFEAMQKHAKEIGYTMPYLLDNNSELADAFGAKSTPHVYLLDKDLKLVYKGAIDNSWDPKRTEEENNLKNAIANVSKDEIVKVNTTVAVGCSIKRVIAKVR